MLSSLEMIRGLVAGSRERDMPVVDLLAVEGGYELSCQAHVLKSARGDRRVFRTSDAALRYVRDHLADPTRRNCEVHVRVFAGDLL